MSSRGCFTPWVTQLSQETALQVAINHGDKQPSHLQVSPGTDESFIKAPISHSFLFYKPFISWYSKCEQIIFFSLKTPSTSVSQISPWWCFVKLHEFYSVHRRKDFHFTGKFFSKNVYIKKKKNYTRKNIFPNLVLPVVTELSLC